MQESNRLQTLDGFRAISIMLVLICHFFPVGPRIWHFGTAVGIYGMSLFFILSGFLVTRVLLENQNITNFLIRRFFRILPLAWLYIAIVFVLFPQNYKVAIPHFLFFANYPPKPLIPHLTDHLWSLCVELHFYIGIALLVLLLNKRGLLLIPFICLSITLLRVCNGMTVSVVTHYRIDEILAGGWLALIYTNQLGDRIKLIFSSVSIPVLFLLLLACSHPDAGWLCYFRPYVAAILIGASLYQEDSTISKFLCNKYLRYIASISFAIYVIHPLIAHSFLGNDVLINKYLKRPLLLLVIFVLAHVSTMYYEKHAINFGKKLNTWLMGKKLRIN